MRTDVRTSRTFGAKSTKSVGRCDSPHTPQRIEVPGTLTCAHTLRFAQARTVANNCPQTPADDCYEGALPPNTYPHKMPDIESKGELDGSPVFIFK